MDQFSIKDLKEISHSVASIALNLGTLVSKGDVRVYESILKKDNLSFYYISGSKLGEKKSTEDFIVKSFLEDKTYFHSSIQGDSFNLYKFEDKGLKGKLEDIKNRRTFD